MIIKMNKKKAIKSILGFVALSYLVHISKILFLLWRSDLLGIYGTLYANRICIIWNSAATIALMILLIVILTEK